MRWISLFFTSEVTFLLGTDVLLFPTLPEDKLPSVRALWGLRVAMLAVWITLLLEGAPLAATWTVFSLALLAYIGSWQAAQTATIDRSPDRFIWLISHLSLLNWALAFPYAAGKRGNGVERGVWLFVNLIVGLIVIGAIVTGRPLKLAYECYPPTYGTYELGSRGICPQSPLGTVATCADQNLGVRGEAYLTCEGDMPRVYNKGAFRAATYIAVVSLVAYFVSMGRNRRRAEV